MYVLHALDVGGEVVAHGLHVELARGGLEQDMAGVADQHPRAAQDQQRHHHRQQRVDRRPARRQDHDRRDDGGNRAQQIADHVQQRALDIEVVAVGAVQGGKGRDVDDDAEHRHHQHRPAEHGDGLAQAMDRLDHDGDGDEEQREPVGVGGEHVHAVEAVGAGPVVRALRHAEGDPGKREGGRVGQHVAGIRDQRQRAREHAGHRLGHHERARQHRGDPDPAAVAGGVATAARTVRMAVAMPMSMRVAVVMPWSHARHSAAASPRLNSPTS